MTFANRRAAGRRLAAALTSLADVEPVVVGLPRGGVPVAAEVARSLHAPLDVIVVRKLGVPFQPELGMGAVGEDGARVLNDDVVRLAHVSEHELAEVERRERAEVERRSRRFRGGRPPVPLNGRVVIVVDDGIATGSTAKAACRVARARGASRVVLAIPVAPSEGKSRIGDDADEYVCLETPDDFYAVGQFYDDFSPTTDDEVVACLAAAPSLASVARSVVSVDNASPTRRVGSAPRTVSLRSPSATSAPAPARLRPSGQRPKTTSTLPPSSRAAADPISPDRASRPCGRRRCSLSADMTTSFSSSTGGRGPRCDARPSSRSSPARPTCSRNRER